MRMPIAITHLYARDTDGFSHVLVCIFIAMQKERTQTQVASMNK